MKPFLHALATLAATLCLAANAAPFLWEVSSMTNKVYLYGTVHAGKADWYPLPAAVEQALQECDVLVVEADISDVEAMRQAQPASYAPPDNLSKHVDPEVYARFRKLLPKYALPEPAVAQMKPFMAVSLLVFSEWARLGYKPEFGVETYLIAKAQQAKKPVREIEGLDVQMRLMIDANPAFLRTFGFQRAEVVGRTSAEIGLWVDPDERERVFETMRREGSVLGCNFRWRSRDGRTLDLVGSFVMIDVDGQRCSLVVAFDLTSRRRAETALLEQQWLLNEAERLTGTGSWQWNMVGNPIWASTEPSTNSTKECTTDCGCTTTSIAA